MSREIDQKSIKENTPSGDTVLSCLICGEDDPDVLENHHVFTRVASERTELLCKNCHASITSDQNKVPPKSRSKNASYLEKIAYQLVTIGALLRDIGKQLIKLGHELIYYVQNCSSGLHQ